MEYSFVILGILVFY